MDFLFARLARRWVAVLVGFAFANAASAGVPVSIAISNPGFEANVASEGCFQVMPLDGWLDYDTNGVLGGGSNVLGGINLPIGSVFYPLGAPEGDHAALVFLLTSTGQGPAGFRQELTDTLQADTTYTLTAQVGNIASGVGPPPCDAAGFFNLDGFPGYQVQLLAGGEVIAQDDNSLAGTLGEGEFDLSTSQAVIGNSHAQLGQALEIRLINLNEAETPQNPGVEVNFDDIQLTAQPNNPPLDGDFDTDCDVDLDDYEQFVLCMGGPNQAILGTCPPTVDADFDNDGDVDLIDFNTFAENFTGAM
ncbi:MAG: hypothetical protein GXP29_09225 [Planctomycetes bacterium]|nr:hypothetical protein [Planctomycetota bacterium]